MFKEEKILMEKLKTLIKEFLNKMHDPGIKFPMACDTQADIPSSTLFFTYLSYILAYVGVIILMGYDALYGAIGAGILYVLSLTFYLMRRISVFRVDVTDGEIELTSEIEEKQPNKPKRKR